MTKSISLPVKGTVYVSPEASAICTIVILLCFRRGQEDLWQRWSHVTKLISNQLHRSLLNCKLTGGDDISPESKANKQHDVYSFHIAVDVSGCMVLVNAVRVMKLAADSS